MTSGPTTLPSPSELRAQVRGKVFGPDDEGYDEARALAWVQVDARPAVVVWAADADDVARVVDLARGTGLTLAVRSGGHSGAGHGTCDGGIVLDLRELKGVDIDPAARTGWAEPGVTAIEFTNAAAEHGLVLGFGDTGSVGLGGLVLGGGVGYLGRKFGLTIDSLLAAEVVTADGRLRRVDADTDADLFWALRGGGGNLGVVTRFRFRLEPLSEVVGGLMVQPATPETVAGFIAAADAAPDELSTIANVMSCPPMPFVPPELHGSLVIMSLICFAGDADAGEEAIRPLRELATPVVDMVRPIRYPEIYPPDDPDYHPTAVARTLFVDDVDRATAELILDRLEASDAPVRVAQLRVLGGAIARVGAEETAYAHRDARIMVNVAAFYEGPEDRPRRLEWVEELAGALRQGDDRAYVNFLADDSAERVQAAYPKATWERLAAVKAQVDPGNVFRHNHNVPPAVDGS